MQSPQEISKVPQYIKIKTARESIIDNLSYACSAGIWMFIVYNGCSMLGVCSNLTRYIVNIATVLLATYLCTIIGRDYGSRSESLYQYAGFLKKAQIEHAQKRQKITDLVNMAMTTTDISSAFLPMDDIPCSNVHVLKNRF